MIKAILFDFNGVIIDDERIQMRAYMEVLKDFGVELTEDEYFSSLGMDDKSFVRNAFERKGRVASADEVDEVRAKKSDRWRNLIDGNIPLFRGVENLIASCSKEFPIGIVSMSKRADIEFVLEQTGLNRFFSHITSAENVTNHKPDPECYRLGFEGISISFKDTTSHKLLPGETLVIEDAPQGILAALSAGLRPMGVANTVSSSRLREAGAEIVANGLSGWTPITFKTLFSD
jgi:HAD superfamily hydrolase (TIGR01509 family)